MRIKYVVSKKVFIRSMAVFAVCVLVSSAIYYALGHVHLENVRKYAKYIVALAIALGVLFGFLTKKTWSEARAGGKGAKLHVLIAISLAGLLLAAKAYLTFRNPGCEIIPIPLWCYPAFLFAAMAEEFMFKGLLLPVLFPPVNGIDASMDSESAFLVFKSRLLTYWVLAIIVSIVFAVSHREMNPAVIVYFVFSLFSFLLFYLWRSLLFLTVFHFLFNIITVFLSYSFYPDLY